MIGDDRTRTVAERAYAEALACQDMMTPAPKQPALWRRMRARLALISYAVAQRTTPRWAMPRPPRYLPPSSRPTARSTSDARVGDRH